MLLLTKRMYQLPLLGIVAWMTAMPYAYGAAPNAGELLRQIQRDIVPARQQPAYSSQEDETPRAPRSEATVSIEVLEFDIRGNRLVDDATLGHVVAGHTGRELNFNELQDVAGLISAFYTKQGWAARVYIPKQEIKKGRVIIRVVEAAFGDAKFDGQFRRVAEQRLQRMLTPAHEHGDPLRIVRLERSILLMNDLPGVQAKAALQSGEHRGETDMLVRVDEGSMWSARLHADSAGARSTGEERMIGTLSLNSPFGWGDRLGLTGMKTSDSEFAQIDYSVPLGYGGLRAHVSGSKLQYELGENFESLDADGEAESYQTFLSYPIVRQRNANIFATLGYEQGKYRNTSLGITLSDYKRQAGFAEFRFDRSDRLGKGGYSSAKIRITSGRIDLDGSPNRAADAATVQANGAYNKVVLEAGRLQWLTPTIQTQVTVRGQIADTNLDSSEHISIGGSRGVRSYPANEASGDEGVLFSAQLRKYLSQTVSVDVFYDHGWARLNHNDEFPGAQARNRFALKGVGMALNWQPPSGLDVSAVWSRRLGSNPIQLPNGRDTDGSLEENRFWFSTSYSF